MPTITRLRGVLDVESLRRAIEAIVARHEPLRTTFHSHEGRPLQRINPPLRFELGVDDLRNIEPNRRESVRAERIQHEANLTFDLEREPAFRASLVRLGDEEYLLL